MPTPAPLDEPLTRVRDRLVEHTLRHRLTPHPAIAGLADLYAQRIAGDEPTAADWSAARNALALDLDRDRALDLALARALDLALALDRARDRDRDLALALALDLVALLGERLAPVERLDAQILDAIGAERWGLDMATYHGRGSCGTTHCRAGSAIVLHPLGAELEQVFGPWLAGAVIYLRSTGSVPDFFAADAAALADLRRAADSTTEARS